jgi:aspartate kinase
MKPGIVMKFGGTSVGTPEAMLQTARIIVSEQERKPLVVISALGGVTNLLTEIAEVARKGEEYQLRLKEILERHTRIVKVHELDAALLEPFETELRRLLSGIEMLRELSPRTKDALLSLGERASVQLLAALLCKLGYRSRSMRSWDLGLFTDTRHNKAALAPETAMTLVTGLDQLEDGIIPIVTGFIGQSLDGEITTLGRGGSDFSAAVFGAAAEVEEIQIWTDVPGFLRADPRVVKEPKVVPVMHFDEAAELAFFGAKVLHPRTIEPARKKGIPVRVLGTFAVDTTVEREHWHKGTLINAKSPNESIRAIAIREKVQTLHIHSLRMLDAPGFLSKVFGVLGKHQISVDVVATSEVSVSMTFDRPEENLELAIGELSEFAKVEFTDNRGLLCVVGEGLRKDPTFLSRIFGVLSENDIPVHVISQGASRINITLVTDNESTRKAMEVLHHEFFAKVGK